MSISYYRDQQLSLNFFLIRFHDSRLIKIYRINFFYHKIQNTYIVFLFALLIISSMHFYDSYLFLLFISIVCLV